jgi:hypothetical protein
MKRSLFALALAAALPVSAQAGELDYSFVELDLARMNVDADGADIDPTGWALKGSGKVSKSFYVFGGYSGVSDDVADLDVDVNLTQVGVGWRHAVSDNADFNAELSYIHQSIDIGENIPLPGSPPPCGCGGTGGGGFIPNESYEANGYRVSGGFRGAMADNFEGWVKANYTDGNQFDGDFSGTIGGQVKFGGMWGITAEGEFGGDYDLYTIGVRANF